ncbi:hypothetical protein [Noviherbaspirillum sp.]|jgi:hypothetical protein|uniref:hypothetical protein n=1 Tax=Noviherbaspirillum sp. TaxID=1926288 RepID=UPI0025EE4520|nr:hypothetical protein [Noviherbaspirillum sp.]
MHARTILAFAPTFLEEEINANLPKVANEHRLSLVDLQAHWITYKALITFIDSGGPDDTYEDPKDAPYLKLQAKLGVLILSRDSDISRMGGRIVETSIVGRLRIYSRHAVVEYALKAGGAGSLTISWALLKAIARVGKVLSSQVRKLPRWFLLCTILLGVAALLHAPTRKRIIAFLASFSSESKRLGETVLNILQTNLVEHERAKKLAAEALEGIQKEE